MSYDGSNNASAGIGYDIRRLIADETGQDLIEYGLLLGIVTTSMIFLGPAIQSRLGSSFAAWSNGRNNLWIPRPPGP